MKRTQQFGWYIRGKVKVRKEMKQAQNRAERTESRRLLKKNPDALENKPKRRYWGYDD